MINLPSPTSNYPRKLDTFVEVADGDGPDNIIHAVYINQVQNALVAIQQHIRYCPSGNIAEGPLEYKINVERKLNARSPGVGRRILEVTVDLDPDIVDAYFNGTPFAARYGLWSSVVAFEQERRRGRVTKNWHRVNSATRVEANQNLQLHLGVIKTNGEWKVGDHIQATVSIYRV